MDSWAGVGRWAGNSDVALTNVIYFFPYTNDLFEVGERFEVSHLRLSWNFYWDYQEEAPFFTWIGCCTEVIILKWISLIL